MLKATTYVLSFYSKKSKKRMGVYRAEDSPKSPPTPSTNNPFGYPSPKEYDAIDARMHLDLQNNPLFDGVLESGVNFVLFRPTLVIGLVALWNAVSDFQKRGLYVKCTSQKLKPSEAFFALWMYHYVKCTLWCPITTTRVLAVAFLLLDRLISPHELGMPELSHRSPTMTVSLYLYWLTLLACMPAIIISHVWLTVCIPFKKTLATQFYTTVSVPAYFFGLCSIVAFTLSIMTGTFAGTPEAPGTLVYLVKVAHPLMMNGLLWDYIFK